MIKAASVQTNHIDDIQRACDDLKSQLQHKLPLLKNSVGIVQCDPEYIEAGMMERLYREFGFPLVGGTTVSVTTNNAPPETHAFSMMVITSDNVQFIASMTNGIKDNPVRAIETAMEQAITAATKPVKLALVFPTVTDNANMPGDLYFEAVEGVCPGLPVFGTLSVNDSVDEYERSMSVYNAQFSTLEMSFVMVCGDVNPRFFVTAAFDQSSAIEPAKITKVENQLICEINGMLALDYFKSVGFAADGKLSKGVYFLPLLITEQGEDGIDRTIVRAMVQFTPEGYIPCRGKVPEEAHISFGSLEAAEILESTETVLAQMNIENEINAALVFSCIIRQLSIGTNVMGELELIGKTIRDGVPFLASYSGGELSPLGAKNYFHNYTLIACIL
ncbi:MAG: FIST C-terminal domain-containing protein [Defluviitaleaceae bacterium]|nr:FIST C-terminal domain-containing protein [Defluviitaleaceae bacterium]